MKRRKRTPLKGYEKFIFGTMVMVSLAFIICVLLLEFGGYLLKGSAI